MVTNIDLSSSEEAPSEHKLGGKSALIFSGVLVVAAILANFGLNYLKNDYVAKEQQAQSDLATKRIAMSGSAFADLMDFQERLKFLDSTLTNRTDWDVFLKEFSQYVMPEVRLNDLSYDPKAGDLTFNAVAPNIDTVAKEVVLLKKFPQTVAVEFGGATENANGDSAQKMSFNIKIKLKAKEQKAL
jgi:Tfp pilus assembly protein PilN